jgi:hypothetical protein
MNSRTVILAFLAARYPAAYDENAILQRVNKSGLLDTPATADSVREELRMLSNRFKFVEPELERVSGEVFWTSTEDGKLEWVRTGQLHVG